MVLSNFLFNNIFPTIISSINYSYLKIYIAF